MNIWKCGEECLQFFKDSHNYNQFDKFSPNRENISKIWYSTYEETMFTYRNGVSDVILFSLLWAIKEFSTFFRKGCSQEPQTPKAESFATIVFSPSEIFAGIYLLLSFVRLYLKNPCKEIKFTERSSKGVPDIKKCKKYFTYCLASL